MSEDRNEELENAVLPEDDEDDLVDADEELEGLTDEGWRKSHDRLKAVLPDDEFKYTWAPGRTAEEEGLL